MKNKKRILICGATDFIGRNLTIKWYLKNNENLQIDLTHLQKKINS